MGHRSDRAQVTREESEKLKEAEMEVDGEVPQEDNAELQSPKSKVIWVESEETQDHVCETLAISQETAQETGFVPSALSEPRGPIYWCDNRCSEKAVTYWQIASMVVEEGGEAHNKFVSAVLQRTVRASGQAAAEIVAMERGSGKESASRENVELWELFSPKGQK